MNTEQHCTAWTTAIAAFNSGDHGPLEQLLTADCVFEHVGRSRDEIIDALLRDRAAGWLRHDTLSINAVASVLTTSARNSFADGSVHHVGGVARFNDDGRIFYIIAADERTTAPGDAA
jgi:hypothetical protein